MTSSSSYMVLALCAIACCATIAQGASVAVSGLQLDPQAPSQHRTSTYRLKAKYMVVRRGFQFNLNLALSTSLPSGYGVAVSTQPALNTLQCKMASASGSSAVATCSTGSNANVGKFIVTASLTDNNGSPISGSAFTATNQPLIVLFNPYNGADDVYLSQQNLLSEYVENEFANVWRGSVDNNNAMKWYVAQFDQNALDTALYMLGRFTGDASDVKLVSRWLTFAITYQSTNRNGLLVGNWGSDFSGGTEPWAWKGSNTIMAQYVSSNFQPVKFAQCWVFGGALNTLLRTLGIPSRQLTTFNSAHESAGPQGYTHVIKRYYDSTGKMVQQDGSVWNFHSWNDAWMKRSDLSGGDGWSAVDSTPQEKSQDVFQMGPASVQKVHDKVDSAQYDNPFVISEVAAEIHNYQVACSGGSCHITKDLGVDEETAGALILTQAPNTDAASDITNQYKTLPSSHFLRGLPGGQAATAPFRERALMRRINKVRANGGFAAMLSSDDVRMGRDVQVSVQFIAQASSGDQRIDFLLRSTVTDYTSAPLFDFENVTDTVFLNASNGYTTTWNFNVTNYWFLKQVPAYLMLTLYAENLESSQALAESITVAIAPPILVVVTPDPVSTNQTYPVILSFQNPLPIMLTNCMLDMEAPTMGLSQTAKYPTVDPFGAFTWEGVFTTTAEQGTQSIIASFTCDQIPDMDGYADVTVTGVLGMPPAPRHTAPLPLAFGHREVEPVVTPSTIILA